MPILDLFGLVAALALFRFRVPIARFMTEQNQEMFGLERDPKGFEAGIIIFCIFIIALFACSLVVAVRRLM